MTNIEDKKKAEIEMLKQDNDTNNIINLEDLILEGANTKIPITFDYPLPTGEIQKVGAMIRPLTATEWNTCSMKAIKQEKTMAVEVVKIGLMGNDGTPIKAELIEKMNVGVINGLFNKISEISGIQEDEEEQAKMIKEIMGF